jgi:hypothetical protein
MQPFDIKLSYRGQSWCTVELEVGYNEIGDADEAEMVPLADDIAEMFARVGLPKPNPLPLMSIEYQIAQKLHGMTSPRANRPHDLTDIQVIVANSKIDMAKLRGICTRLFSYRRQQAWPPKLQILEDWRATYDEWRDLAAVKPTLEEAVNWVNEFISEIDNYPLSNSNSAPATLNSEPIPLPNCLLATLALATLPHWQHSSPDTEAALRQLLFVICEQLCQLRFVNNHKNQSQNPMWQGRPRPCCKAEGGLATSCTLGFAIAS